MSVETDRLAVESLTPIHWIGVALAILSALIHFVLGVEFLPHPMGVAFILAAAGFVGGVGLLLVGYRRRTLYLIGIPYTGVQIVLWYVLNQPRTIGEIPESHLLDKLTQALLVVVLVVLYRRAS